jgi:RNA binding activity-knot of a chromodomain
VRCSIEATSTILGRSEIISTMSTPKYKEGSVVFRTWNNNVYEAKVLQVVQSSEQTEARYRVHYKRFSKKWDETVEESILFEKRAEALAHRKKSPVGFLQSCSPKIYLLSYSFESITCLQTTTETEGECGHR